MSPFVVNLSGGKDSTAVLLMLLERGEDVHSAVFFDTGWEFPSMLVHMEQLRRSVPVPIVTLHPDPDFNHWMFNRPVRARSGPQKGQVHHTGKGWPSWTRRWCTRLKVEALERYRKTIPGAIACIGYAADERRKKVPDARYPLIEWGMTERQALRYCLARGYGWDGLYDYFERASCFCCPLQSLACLRTLRRHYPTLWARMINMDERTPAHNKGFRGNVSVCDLDCRFAKQEKQGRLL